MAIKGFEKKDPMEQFNQMMQLINQMNQFKDRKKQSISSNLSTILEASKYSTNQESIENVINNYSKMESDSQKFQETTTQYDLIGNILKDRSSQISQYTKSVNDAENIINGADFLDKESEFVDLHSNVLSMKDDNGNQKYESVMEWVSQEYARVEGIGMNLLSGQKMGLKRGQGIDDSNITSQIGQYQKRLNVALEALIGDNTITAEEANLIIAGDRDTFKQARNNKVAESQRGIAQYDGLLELIDKRKLGLSGSQSSETMIDWIQKSGMGDDAMKETMDMANEEGIFGMNLTELELAEKNYTFERNNLIDTYKSWSGTDYIGQFKSSSEIGADEFGKFADASNNKSINLDGTSPLNLDYKETNIDKDKDGVPDTVDIDAGIGTGKTVVTPEAEKSFRNKDLAPISVIELKKQKAKSRPQTHDFIDTQIKDAENRLKEKQEILDGKDKASIAMNKYLTKELNQDQALTEGAFGGKKSRTEVVGQRNRQKLKAFQDKFNNSNLTIEEFIAKNQKEYYEMTKLFKYGKYWKKEPIKFPSEHYINLYD